MIENYTNTDLRTIWCGISNNLADRFENDDMIAIQQAVFCELGKYDISEKATNTEISIYNDEMTGYTMFFCSKGVEGLSKRTLKFYKETVDRFLCRANKPLNLITTDDIRFYLAQRLTKDKVSTTTMENERRNLSSFFGWLSEEGYISKNVCKPIKKIKSKKEKKKAFSDVEIQKIKDACSVERGTCKKERVYRSKALVEFLLSTGCRVGEISTLKREKVDLDRCCATVIGKGNKERVVYLTQVSKMRLKEYWDYSGKKEYAFTSLGKLAKSEMFGIGQIEKEIREIGKIAGVENTHPHRFRRTCATIALKKGMNLVDVQKMLGHENLDTTKIYLDLDSTDLEYQHTKIFG